MTIKGFLAAIAFVVLLFLFAFSIWAEWGPYAWVAAVQIATMNEYAEKLTFLLVFLLFWFPAMALFPHINAAGRPTQILAFGIPALFAFVHISATVYFLCIGGTPPERSTLASALRSTTFLPQGITLKTTELPAMDLEHVSGITRSGSASDYGDMYIPFVNTIWPNPEMPVVLKTDSFWLKYPSKDGSMEGTLRKAPLPYLVRRSWTENHSKFAIIFENRGSIRMYWLQPAIIYAIGLFFGAKSMFAGSPTQLKQ